MVHGKIHEYVYTVYIYTYMYSTWVYADIICQYILFITGPSSIDMHTWHIASFSIQAAVKIIESPILDDEKIPKP